MQTKATNVGCSVVRKTKAKAATRPFEVKGFSENARSFGYLARAFGLDGALATQAWQIREFDGQFLLNDEMFPEMLTLNEAKQKCLEYEEAIREKALELESVQAYNMALQQYATFSANWILRNSGRILPKLISLKIL
jgi:hypothetical protein